MKPTIIIAQLAANGWICFQREGEFISFRHPSRDGIITFHETDEMTNLIVKLISLKSGVKLP